jgi:5-methylthioadenosine/S-adenosylhomocysteine deaminase
MAMIDLLVRADYLYPVSEGMPIIRDGEVAIAADRIVYAGPRKAEGSWQARRVVAGGGKAVLPGLVNCHSHTASVIFRSQTDDFTAGVGLYSIAFRMEKEISPEEWHALALLGCIDMLRAGITTINDLWYSPDRLAAAVEQSGLRAMIANKIFDVRLEALHAGDYARERAAGAARLRTGVEFVERWNGKANGRISGRIGTHASDTCDPALHREARAEARRLGVGMHIHTAQSAREVEHITATRGCGPLEYLRDIGLLADDVVCAHLTFASDGDLDAVRETGARYAHCPTIYPRRGRYPRLDDIRRRGIVTGFATDWMLNDPFEGMRNAMNATRLLASDADLLPSQEALWHHKMGSARVLGLDHEIGSLEAGKKADLIVLDLDRAHLQPYYGGYPALVYYAKTSDLMMSVIDGEIVIEEGRPIHLDEAAILADIKRRVPAWRETLRALGSTALAAGDGACGGC